MTEQDIYKKTEKIEDAIKSAFTQNFPLYIRNNIIDVENLRIERPDMFNLDNEIKAKDSDSNLSGKVYGVIVVKDKNGKTLSQSKEKVLLDVPYLTNRGTYIIGGKEKVISKQMRLKPGAYTYSKGDIIETFMFLERGKNLTLQLDTEGMNLKVDIGGRTLNAIMFMRILGITDAQIAAAINDPRIEAQLFKKAESKNIGTETSKLWNILKKSFYYIDSSGDKYPGQEKAIEDIRSYFFNMASFGDTGSKVMEATLGHSTQQLDKEVFLRSISKIIGIAKSESQDEIDALSDDKDDIRFQNILDDDYQIKFHIIKGIEELSKRLTRETRGMQTHLSANNAYNKNVVTAPLNSFMSKGSLTSSGSLVDLVEQTNPLLMSAAHRKVTSLGEGGLSRRSATQETRNLQNTEFGKLDPVETPESGKIGLVNHLTHVSKVEDLTIKTPYYKVSNGAFKAIDSNKKFLEPFEEHSAYIAFHNTDDILFTGNTGMLKEKVWVRHNGRVEKVPREKVDYVDTAPHSIWGDATAMIPFNAHNDGNRMLMGSNMQKQALPLIYRQAPLVQSAVDRDKKMTFEKKVAEEYGFLLHAKDNGTVKSIDQDRIVIENKDGNLQEQRLMNYFPLNMSHYIKHEPLVKTGDKVKQGQLISDGWQTKDGTLALGRNARIAYMPWKGYNFEDGFVISESFAKNMASEETKEIVVEVSKDQVAGPGSNIKEILAKKNVPRSQLDKLDDNGVIKVGELVDQNTILVGIARLLEEDQTRLEYKFTSSMFGVAKLIDYRNESKTNLGYLNGKVIRVVMLPGSEEKKFSVKITIVTNNPLQEGDKLAGRFGNKGIITKIEKDSDMPIAEDGEAIDIIYSPLGVPSRKNLGQLYEANAGLIASKTGKPFIVYNFDRNDAKAVEDGLKEIGYPDGKMTLTNPETGKPFENKVTVGVGYMMKLKHKVDDKLQARYFGQTHRIYDIPSKKIGVLAGEKSNPQTLGEYEMRALQAHKAVNFMDEAVKYKSDAAGSYKDREAIFNALAFGGLPRVMSGMSGTPRSMEILQDYTAGLGLNMKPLDNRFAPLKSLDEDYKALSIAPFKASEIRKFSRGEVTNDKVMKNAKKGDVAEKGGIMDPKIFGETEAEKRAYWGHIDLASPLPNPMFMTKDMNPYAILLGKQVKDIESIIKDKVGVITTEGDSGFDKYDIVELSEIEKLKEEGKNFKYELKGEALNSMLSEINLDEELKRTQNNIISAKPKDRANYYKKLRVLSMLKQNNMQPQDILVTAVPVIPAALRPLEFNKSDNKQIEDDLNDLYGYLIQTNNGIKDFKKSYLWDIVGDDIKDEALRDSYKFLEGISGTNTVPIKKRGRQSSTKELQGISSRLSRKTGFIRNRLMSKQLDYSGRSVITVNPSLGMDEAGLPVDIATKLYKPFIMNELYVNRGVSKLEAESMSEDPDNPATWDALQKVVKDRPIILNRAPSLHKYSLQAFNPKLTKSKSIELNPLVVTGFNADFDGDQMAVHIPLTSESIREARNLMMPSKILMNPTDGTLVTSIQGESILGLYYLTLIKGNKGSKSTKTYTSYESLFKDYKEDKVRTYDQVMLGSITATAGQHLVNEQLPIEYRDYTRVMNKKVVTKLIESMIAEDERPSKIKSGGSQVAALTLNKLKDIGFLGATKSALSIGVFDLPQNTNKLKLLERADKEIEDNPSKALSVYEELEGNLSDQLLTSLGKNNPMYMFLDSGAKGKVNQVSKMTDVVGLSRDITGKVQPIPITSSFREGLSPSEMWTHTFDSRRGMADRSISVSAPGMLTRLIWSSTQDVMITEDDCAKLYGAPEGVTLSKDDSSVLGRFLAKPIYKDDGSILYNKDRLILQPERDQIRALKKTNMVSVRSPLNCKLPSGVCKKCYGTIPGTFKEPTIGDPVGVLASQAIGEPTAQGTMKTFHQGGIGKTTTLGFDRVNELFNMSDNPKYKATVTPITGKVLSVNKDILNTVITVEGVAGGSKVTRNIKVPLAKDVLVRPGDYVTMGDKIAEPKETEGVFSPGELLSYKGLGPTQNYVVDEIVKSMRGIDANTDRKHIELAVGRLTDKVEIEDNSTSNFIPGQIVKRNVVDIWNSDNIGNKQSIDIDERLKLLNTKIARPYKDKQGNLIAGVGETISVPMLDRLEDCGIKKVEVYAHSIQYKPVIYGVVSNPKKGSDNWFSQLGTRAVNETLTEGAAYGKVDLLNEPRSRQMAGKLVNIGEGFKNWKEEWDKIKDRTKQTIANLFG